MMSNEITIKELNERINEGMVVLLDCQGNEIPKSEFMEQFNDGWNCGFVVYPISNNSAHQWAVATSGHSDHHGFDAGECLEIIMNYEELGIEFVDDWANSGGMIFEIKE